VGKELENKKVDDCYAQERGTGGYANSGVRIDPTSLYLRALDRLRFDDSDIRKSRLREMGYEGDGTRLGGEKRRKELGGKSTWERGRMGIM